MAKATNNKLTVKGNPSMVWLVLIQWVMAVEWLQSGWGKFTDSKFMDGIEKTLGAFSSPKNPNEWYASFLRDTAVPNADMFGNLVRTSELLGGLVLLIGGFLVLRSGVTKTVAWVLAVTLLGLAFMNTNFYFAAGYTSPSTAGVNMVMGLTQLILGVFYLRRALRAK